ncbi:MAG TPA: glycosyltransferase family 39 protein [Acidimicrobiales bacterium]|nr:glycosyltransferase family 39 protein [Acidimicrobiales bacterium]
MTEQALGADGGAGQGNGIAAAPGHVAEPVESLTGARSDPSDEGGLAHGESEQETAPERDEAPSRLQRLWLEWRRPLTIAISATLGFRLIVTWIALVSANGVQFPHLVARHPGVLTQILAQWDAGYYLTLAAHGYPAHAAAASAQTGNRAFYAFGPLYPLLVRITHDVLRFGYITSGEIVSTLGLVVALAALWKLVDLEVGRRAADAACVMLLAWPSAFFLVTTYPESVTLAVATLAFYAARRGHYVAAGLLAAAAAMGKYYLVLLVVPLALEVWWAPHQRATWRAGRDLAWLSPLRVTAGRLAAVLGPTVLVFVAWVSYQQAHFGEWTAFLRSQAQWHRHVSWPWTSIGHAVSDLVHWRLLDTSTASVVELFDLVTVVLIALAAVVAWIRIRPSYGVLLALVWCVFTFQTILLSESREVLVLFPFFAALGVWVARHQWRERALLFLFLPCGYFLLERFVTGKFAG